MYVVEVDLGFVADGEKGVLHLCLRIIHSRGEYVQFVELFPCLRDRVQNVLALRQRGGVHFQILRLEVD